MGTRFLVAGAALLLTTAIPGQDAEDSSDEGSGANADDNGGSAILDYADDSEPYVLDPDEREPELPENDHAPGYMTLRLHRNPQADIDKNEEYIEARRAVNDATSEDVEKIMDKAQQAQAQVPANPSASERREERQGISEQKGEELDESFKAREEELARIDEEYCAYWRDEVSVRAQLYNSLSTVCQEVRTSDKEVCSDTFKENVVRRGGAYVVNNIAEDRSVRANLPAFYYAYEAADAVRGPGEFVNEVVAPTAQEYGDCKRQKKVNQRLEYCPDSRVALNQMQVAQGNANLRCHGD